MTVSRSSAWLAVLSLFAAGLVFGLGFVAAASKFMATTPSILALLDVGRMQFIALHVLESVLIPVVFFIALFESRAIRVAGIVTFGLFLVQMLAILPGLDARMVARLAGETPGPSPLHDAYMGVSGGMLIGLMACGILATGLIRIPERATPFPTAGPNPDPVR
jgi:hypothetical protein